MATQRFLTLDDVAEILNVSWSQAYALVRRKELIAIQIGGRGQWRVGGDELEGVLQQKEAEAPAGTRPPAGSPQAPAPAPPRGGPPRPGAGGGAPRRPPATAPMTTAGMACPASARRGMSSGCSASST